jgi:hypothetical protein
VPRDRRAVRRGHHSGIGHDEVEAVDVGEDPVGESPHRREIGEIERSQVVGGRVDTGRGESPLALGDIAHREHEPGTVRGERSGRLDTEP